MYRELQVVKMGSRVFPYSVPLIAATLTYWYDLTYIFGNEMRLWDYFDSLVVQNNSALPVHFYLNSTDDDYYILAYGTQPISRRPFRRFGVYNPDLAVDIAADLVTLTMRRLPSGVLGVVSQS